MINCAKALSFTVSSVAIDTLILHLVGLSREVETVGTKAAQPHLTLAHSKICFWLECSLWFILALTNCRVCVLRSATRFRFAAVVVLRANAAFGAHGHLIQAVSV